AHPAVGERRRDASGNVRASVSAAVRLAEAYAAQLTGPARDERRRSGNGEPRPGGVLQNAGRNRELQSPVPPVPQRKLRAIGAAVTAPARLARGAERRR